MTLTVGTGPLAGQPNGSFNYTIESPAHRIMLQDYPLRLRAMVGDRVVLDSTRVKLLHETGQSIRPYAPLEDFHPAALERTVTRTHCPFKGDASYWSVSSGDRVVADAIWAYESPLPAAPWLSGLAALDWGKADAWFVEGDRAFGPHLRDPYHRVDVWESDRPVSVRVGGTVIAETDRPKLVFETSLPLRVYVPAGDVAPGVLAPSEMRSQCPYKGESRYLTLEVDGRVHENTAWTYDSPLPEAARIAGHVAFEGDEIQVELGEPAA